MGKVAYDIKKIQEMYAKGMSYPQMTEILNEDRLKMGLKTVKKRAVIMWIRRNLIMKKKVTVKVKK